MTAADACATAVVTSLAVLLARSSVAKLRRPEPLRASLDTLGVPRVPGRVQALALVELAVAIAAVTAPVRTSGPILAALFAMFAGATALLTRQRPDEPCGCFGEQGTTARSRLASCLNVLAATAAGLAATQGSPSVGELATRRPLTGLTLVAVGTAAAAVWRRALAGRRGADLPQVSDRMVTTASTFLEQRISRRSALTRFAMAGSALCVAPLRYLLYPGSAMAAIAPASCTSGDCTDGYTAFCCEINHGLNQCPSGTFPGGWWMCTDYRGRKLCATESVRYYVDCNALPGRSFPGGCVCANDSCSNRRVNCNVFRYGQCNTHIGGVTPVVCRMVVCQNPGSIPTLNCSSSVSVDNAVCGHEAACLETPALELAGAGGV